MSSTLKSQRLEEPVPPTVSAGRNDIFLGDVVAHVSAPECRCLLSNTTGMRITVAQEEPGRMDANAPAWIINMRYGDRIYRAVYRMVYNAAGPENGFRATLAGCLHPDEPLPFEIALTQRMRISGLKELRGVIPRRDGTFALQPVTNASPLEAGWSLDGKPRDRIALALPLLGFSSAEGNDRVLSIATDPYRGVEYTLSTLETEPGTALLEFTSSFGGDSDPRPSQSRTVLVAAHPDGEAQFLDTFYETISHIEPGPAWVREIRLNYYDYIANVGKALEPDLSALAAKIPESYRRHVLVCLHGYYDYLGRYTFDSKARRLDDQWTSYDNQARPLPMSKVELRRRIRLVKSFGFRCALYFADSLAYDDASPDFNPAWTWRAPSGQPAHWYYWQKRPDSTGLKNYRLDPANPEVRQWFLDYARSLIAEYGRDLDALVWDETFTENPVGPEGQRKLGSVMTGVDSAMMSLVASLTQEVQKAWLTWPDLAFLTSDNIRDRNRHVPFALVSHGTYQDSACEPGAWDFGRLPNFRNAMISCNWYPIGNRDYNRLAVETYDRPQGVSNGYGDERGPAEMPPDILDEIVQRFLVQVDGL